MGSFSVTVHEQGKRSRASYASLDEALEAVAAEVSARSGTRASTVRAFTREVEPGDQVIARIELHGPRAHGGVDLRGDGTAQAFTGRWARRPVASPGRETAPQALRRALDA